MRIIIFSALLTIFLASGATAQPLLPKDPILIDCKPTPVATNESYPGEAKIMQSSKLARPAGKTEFALGQLVYLSGRVLDENCVPVAGAVVDIWQTDSRGRYRYPDKGSLVNPYPVFAGSGRAVTDNLGRYSFITIYPGSYRTFISKPEPGHYVVNAPHVHFYITHDDFKPLLTKMYFEGDRRNEADPSLKKLNEELRKRISVELYPRRSVGKGKKVSAGPLIPESDARLAAEKEAMEKRVSARMLQVDPNDADAGLVATFDITLRGKNAYHEY